VTTTASGIQVYSCEYDAQHHLAWVFKSPQATLYDTSGHALIMHSAGPSWEAEDGSRIVLRKCEDGYDPTNRSAAQVYIQERMKDGEYLTGLLFVEPSQNEFHTLNGTPDEPLNSIPYEKLSPGAKGLEKILSRYR